MDSTVGASAFRGERLTRRRLGMRALLPVHLPPPRPWCQKRRGPGAAPASPRVGVDLVAIAKVQRVFEGRPGLLAEVFTPEELRYATRQRRPFLHLAARFAAKEAVFKSLGTGQTAAMTWRDVETVHGERGQPRLLLHREAARLALAQGLVRCAISLTHADQYAMAAVLLTA